ncbi:MAG: deoxyribodipyrimidine photo-lyase [Planctomycetaceae bacterium]|nr:deoxyribodipyrimidine photo-lyase [Planctomycetaceae bacterium]
MSTAPSLVWFRHDLRLADQPALQAAMDRSGPVIPVYIWAPEEEEDWAPASCSRWWLHHSLDALSQRLELLGVRLIIRRGPTEVALSDLIRETGADAVFWTRRYEPEVIERDKQLKQLLKSQEIEACSFNGALLVEPWEVATQQGKPYQVFTPYWKAAQEKLSGDEPLAAPERLKTLNNSLESVSLQELNLLPTIPWDTAFHEQWMPGETGAQAALNRFLDEIVSDYKTERDVPGRQGTSRLSPHLHFGEISPRQIVQAMRARKLNLSAIGPKTFLTELGWREFAHHVLYHFPKTPQEPLRAAFNEFPWNDDPTSLRAWQRGQTGYPIVDAGMRELWATGWMHNRVRMIVGSFLTKHLRLPWQAGAEWFWDTLVDADLANNTLGWQWISGCGADAAPYFRVFNPILQGVKFDPDGTYVRRWCPELADVPDKWLHNPWEAPASVLTQARVRLGRDYPEPIVDHATARDAALAAFALIKK